MFSFMIVVNYNGELKSVSAAELGGYILDGSRALLGNLEDVLSNILDEREAKAEVVSRDDGWHEDFSEGSD